MARLQGRSSTKTVGGQSFKEFRAPCLADGETSFWEVLMQLSSPSGILFNGWWNVTQLPVLFI